MKHTSTGRSKSAAVKDIDIADILGQKYQYHIDIGHGDIDPPLHYTHKHLVTERRTNTYTNLDKSNIKQLKVEFKK